MSSSLRYGLFFSALFFFLGIQLPYIAGWMAGRGLTPFEISLILGGGLIGRILLTPFVAISADRAADPRVTLRRVALLMLAGAAGLIAAPGLWTIAFAGLVVLWSFGAIVPLIDVAALAADRAGHMRYGRVRAAGSGLFVVANIAGGALIEWAGFETAAWMMAVAVAVMAGAAYLLPPSALVKGAAPGVRLWPDGVRFARRPEFLLFLLILGCVQGGHSAYYAFSILHWASLGYSETLIGVLWAVGVLAEIVLLAFGATAMRRLGPIGLLMLGGGAAIVRWTLTGLEPPVAILFLLQMMHAFTFAATHLGTLSFVEQAAPKRLSNTALTLASATGIGAISGLSTVLAGWLFGAYGAGAAYGAMAVMGAGGVLGCLVLARIWRGGVLSA